MSARLTALLAISLMAVGCLENPFATTKIDTGDARVDPIPAFDPVAGSPTGTVPLGLGGARDGLLYIPASYDPGVPAPMVVLLHGAGGDAAAMLGTHTAIADTLGVILLSIDSRAYTWDAILARFSLDPPFISSALAAAASRYNIDRRRVGLSGFSDGASYALALGRANGDIFRKVVAHSPGTTFAVHAVGRPAFYVAHGVQDPILPFGITRDILVGSLRVLGYDVRFVEFEGGHSMRLANISESVRWIASP